MSSLPSPLEPADDRPWSVAEADLIARDGGRDEGPDAAGTFVAACCPLEKIADNACAIVRAPSGLLEATPIGENVNSEFRAAGPYSQACAS